MSWPFPPGGYQLDKPAECSYKRQSTDVQDKEQKCNYNYAMVCEAGASQLRPHKSRTDMPRSTAFARAVDVGVSPNHPEGDSL